MGWEIDKPLITEQYFEIINISNIELFGIIRENLEEINPVFPLIKFILSRLETVSSLTTNYRLWDAEIILRSALETFIKFMFITSASENEKDKRIDEYWNSLSEINSLKQSDQAKRNIKYFGENEIHRLANSPLILPDDLEQEIRARWPKAKRQRLEQKWSFSEILFSLSKNNKGNPLEIIITLTHSYRIGSHIMHGDETGVLIIEERETRTPEEKEKVEAGHYLRLLSDCASYSSLVATETLTYLNLKNKRQFFFDNQKKLDEIQYLINRYKGKAFDDPDYDKFRTP